MPYKYLETGNSIIVVIEGTICNFNYDNYMGKLVRELLKQEGNENKIIELCYKPIARLAREYPKLFYSVTVNGATSLWHASVEIPAQALEEYLLEEGNITAIANFLNKCDKIKNDLTRQNLVNYVIANKLFIHSNGNFDAYKSVTTDYMDHYTNSICHEVGKTISLPKRKVNFNSLEPCAAGLHAATLSYALNFKEGKIVIVHINPKHVAATCPDKIRCTKYTIQTHVEQCK